MLLTVSIPPNLDDPRIVATENGLKLGGSNSAQTRMESVFLQNPVRVYVRLCKPTH